MTDSLFSVPIDGVVEKTMPMKVANTGFMVDRLGQDCAPLQFLRELTQNAIEAILVTPEQRGHVIWDVDWQMHQDTGQMKLCVIDNGCGMTGKQMAVYINQLSSSVHQQAHDGNFGVGAKIAAATRNHAGLLYLSWQDGVGEMIQLWRDPATGEYGLRQLPSPSGRPAHWTHVSDAVKPGGATAIDQHGTKVVLLGNDDDDDTMQAPPGAPSSSRWVARYLNTRYFRFPEGITVKARQGWEYPRADTKNNVLRTVTGQESYLEEHKETSGKVILSDAMVHWWILKDEPALDKNTGHIASSGHVAALYRDELYEMITGRAGTSRLQQFGVIFGYKRVVIYVEPRSDGGTSVSSNTARTQLLMNNELLPWADWAAEFRSPENFPAEIKQLEEDITAGTAASDHRQAIRERLEAIRDLFRFTRYRATPKGDKLIGDESGGTGGKRGTQSPDNEGPGGSGRRGTARRSGRAGGIYSLYLAEDGEPGEAIEGATQPRVLWISRAEGTRSSGHLEDRAAKFLPEQNILQINGDFRGFTDLIDRWTMRYGNVPGARQAVEDACREWFEQALVETVMGLQSLKESPQWNFEDYSKCISEEALTAAVMPRYHIDVAVKRALGAKLGSLRDKVS